ncbi:histidinol-phosphatase [Methylobrevis albus]|uniref:Histidinol-phosphatase n=1 Tax=Methylobrevis albus TaxID=2793297 RepID=A0A931I395_9HYPH|nr:histidinol-phosphatase [Methylobrevis albus]MBH0239445.1 histidinol-phosphatase [Methylobrevis albus]
MTDAPSSDGFAWLPFVDRLADAASAAILPHFRSAMAVENKEALAFDPVTVADKGAEEAIRGLIGADYPEHGILGEEYGDQSGDAEHVWVIDPIDGTRAFISGLPVWGTLIGLKRHGVPVFGMMAQPFTGERFSGDGKSAYYTGPGGERPLKTRKCAAIGDATLFTTTPALFKGADRAAYDRVERAARLPRYGCDCYAYCMLAAGQIDLVVETELKTFDIMPLIPVIEGAGGVVTNWDGGSAIEGGRIVAAGDPRLHAAVLEMLAG